MQSMGSQRVRHNRATELNCIARLNCCTSWSRQVRSGVGSALGLEDLEHGYGSSLTIDLSCFLVALTTISHVNTTPYTHAGKVTTSGKCAQSVEALLFFTTKRVRATVVTGGPLNLRVSLERWIQLFTLGTWSRKDPPQSPRRGPMELSKVLQVLCPVLPVIS